MLKTIRYPIASISVAAIVSLGATIQPAEVLGQSRGDTLLYVGFEWPSVGSQLGDNYDEFFRTPVSQNVMTRQLHVRITRMTRETALAMLREAGYAVREGSTNPQPSEISRATRYALRGRLSDFVVDTRGRSNRRVEVTMAIRWDVVDLSNGRTVYSEEFTAESERALDGDRFGSYLAAVTNAFEEIFGELRLDREFISLLASRG